MHRVCKNRLIWRKLSRPCLGSNPLTGSHARHPSPAGRPARPITGRVKHACTVAESARRTATPSHIAVCNHRYAKPCTAARCPLKPARPRPISATRQRWCCSSTPRSRPACRSRTRARLATVGANALVTTRPAPAWRHFLAQFQDPLVNLLLAAAAITLAVWALEGCNGWPLDAVVILVIVCLNAVLGFVQETRSQRATAALARMRWGRACRWRWSNCPG